uniref:Secreted protein n=1 Tax=Ascaris lumbricoides TaxID=6252 RepID=A0A0M3HL76_ASCLU
MYRENPKRSLRPILSASASQNSFAVVAESAFSVFTVPSISVTANTIGFFDFVAYNQ